MLLLVMIWNWEKVMTKYRNSHMRHKNDASKKVLAILLFIVFWPIGIVLILRNYGCKAIGKWYVVLAITIYVIIFSSLVTVIAKQSVQAIVNKKMEAGWHQMIDEEMSREYYIDISNPIVNGVVTVDCNMKQVEATSSTYSGSDDQFQCQEVDIVGEFSKYDTTKLVLNEGQKSNFSVAGNRFSYSDSPEKITNSIWESDSFNPNSYKTIEDTVKLAIRNKKINNGAYDIYERTIKIVYQLSDDEMEMLKQHNDAYNEYVAEQKRVAAEEARKQAEEAQKRAAEEEAKRQAEEAQKQAEQSQSSQQQSSTQTEAPENNQSAINEGRAACASYLEYAGFPNAKIKVSTVRVYSDGTPTGIYIQGQATYDPGITQAERSIGTVNCRYDTSTGQVLGLWANGVAL